MNPERDLYFASENREKAINRTRFPVSIDIHHRMSQTSKQVCIREVQGARGIQECLDQELHHMLFQGFLSDDMNLTQT